MGVVYTFVNGEKKYLYLPKVDKPAYWIAYDTKVNVETSYRTYYKINLDGSENNESIVFDWGYSVGSESNNPFLSCHEFFPSIQKTVIGFADCNSVAQDVPAHMNYKIYDANMNVIKTFQHSIEWPTSYKTLIANNDRNLILVMFSGFNNTGSSEIVNPRYLRIIDVLNLRMLTKTFIWPNGKQGEVIASWYNPNTKKLRVMCKDWYDTTGFPTLQNQAMAVNIYEVNLTDDEYDIQPISIQKFNTLQQPYWAYFNYSQTWGWDPKMISISPTSGTATINNYTRPVGNTFYFYNFETNTWTSVAHTQSYNSGNIPCRGGVITSPNRNDYVFQYLKWLDVSKSDSVLFRYSKNGLTTPANGIGQRWNNGAAMTSWNEDYMFTFAASDSTSGVAKVAIYWTDNNDNYNYYLPTIYESRTGNPISSTASASIGYNANSSKYMTINRTETSTSDPLRYMNVICRDNIYNTIKLDMLTNTAFPGIKSWTGFFTY